MLHRVLKRAGQMCIRDRIIVVDDGATAGIDDHGAILHLFEDFSVEHVGGLWGQHDVDGDDVAAGDQLLKGHELHIRVQMCIRDSLYHYDEGEEALTFETSARIAADGSAALRMTHASQYAIVIDEKSHALPFEDAVSYTHLDVYKRQVHALIGRRLPRKGLGVTHFDPPNG